jgi:hypothetical protein
LIRRLFTGREIAPAARRAQRRRPALETLEGRALLSFIGSIQRVSFNPEATDNTDSDNASSANGTSVAVWVNAFAPTDHDIWAQFFDGTGHPNGSPIAVDFTTADSFHPRVAMDSQGRFVVTWENDSTNGNSTIWMSYFDTSGQSLTGPIQVSSAGERDLAPDVAMSDGSIVVTWEQFGAGTSTILGERFVIAAGLPRRQSIFTVNRSRSLLENPSVAMAPDGRFGITYDEQVGFSAGNFDIIASQYGGGGNLVRANIPINTDPQIETNPSIAMDNAGNAVVVYRRVVDGGVGVYANRLSSAGAVSGLITVQDVSGIFEDDPAVALEPTGGRFVVSYAVFGGGRPFEHQVTEMAADNTPLATLGPVDLDADPSTAISIDSLGRFFMTFASSGISAVPQNIYSRRDVLGSEGLVSVLPLSTSNFQTDNASSANGTSVVVWTNVNGFTNHDIWAQLFDRNGRPAGAAIAVDTLTTDDSLAPRVAMDSQGRFVVTWVNRNPGDTFSVMTRSFSAAGAPLTGVTRVTAAGSNDTQPDVAAADGLFVITWTHQASATNDDIQAERFVISGGVPQGQGIFSVVSDANVEDAPSVAMSPDGRFDIAYERQFSGADWDIFASQYGITGAPLRSSIFINFDSNPEHNPSIAMDTGGNAVVAYQELINGIVNDIVANRLGSDGSVGPRIFVATPLFGNALNPSVALAPTGHQFVVAYESASAAGVSEGVRTVEVAADDTVRFHGDSTDGPFNGVSPAVSIDGFGRYIVTYERFNPATNRADIFSRRFFLT